MEEHPILHLDLNTENYKEPDSLRRRLDSTLSYWEQLMVQGGGDLFAVAALKGL